MNATNTFTESTLINECINGNRKSQKELYDTFATKMFTICLRYTKNEMDAQDVLQDGFVKLFNNLHKFRGEGSFEGWARRIFVNTAIEQIRRKKEDTVVSEGLENSLKESRKNGLDNLYEKDLLAVTNTLSDGYRTVFKLYAIEGYSHKEIASHLGISESTSKSQLSRAKSTLRSMLGNARINDNEPLVA